MDIDGCRDERYIRFTVHGVMHVEGHRRNGAHDHVRAAVSEALIRLGAMGLDPFAERLDVETWSQGPCRTEAEYSDGCVD